MGRGIDNLNKCPLKNEHSTVGQRREHEWHPSATRFQAKDPRVFCACGKHVTHCYHNLIICRDCSLVRWNCLHKAEEFWWYKVWLNQAASSGAAVCMGKPKASPETRLSTQRLGYNQQMGWGI
jgi:hypothetical protein